MKSNHPIILELQYFPPVLYFAKMAKHGHLQLEAHENYIKGTYRNRCHIAGANGVQRLSIPLRKGKNRQQPIQEVAIAYDQPWQSEHWHSIKSAYGNSPFFAYYKDELQPFFKQKSALLWDWNRQLLDKMIDLTGLNCQLSLTGSYKTSTELAADPTVYDYRNCIQPKKSRLIEETTQQTIPYGQVFMEKHGFLPNLSILDLLFCQGPASSEILRKMNDN